MSDPMSDERLAEIRERAKYATDGPWKVDEPQRLKDASLRYVIAAEAEDVAAIDVAAEASAWRFHRKAAELDAAFIAHARQDVPALLAEVERLRAEQAQRIEQAVHGFFTDADQRGVHLDGMTVTELCDAVMAEIRKGPGQ